MTPRTEHHPAQAEQPARLKSGQRLAITLAVLALLALLYALLPGLRKALGRFTAALVSGDIEQVKALILSYGGYAMAISFLLMVFSSVIAPLPAFLITFSNAAIFGWWQGAILSWSSAMVGAALCFFLARGLGRGFVEKITGKGALAGVEDYFRRYGTRTVLICRLLPFVSFDAISYFSGLTAMAFLPFWAATGLGQLPATLVYSYVGGMLTGGVKFLVTGLLLIFALMAAVPLIKKIYDSAQKRKEAGRGC